MPNESSPRGLGEGASGTFVLERQLVPLPADRQELIKTFSDIVNAGGVMRVLVQVGQPIEVQRYVRVAQEAPQLEEDPSDDLLDRVRNGEMRELKEDERLPAGTLLLLAFHELDKEELNAAALYVRSRVALKKWLGVGQAFNASRVYGIPVHENKDLPEDAVILVGSSDENVLGIRVPVPEAQRATAVTIKMKAPTKRKP